MKWLKKIEQYLITVSCLYFKKILNRHTLLHTHDSDSLLEQDKLIFAGFISRHISLITFKTG
jgi:hypothetical protein